MKILSWNIAGLRAKLKQNKLDFLFEKDFDIICFQETKTLPNEIKIPQEFNNLYPYKYWNSNLGETQKKGFSGTCIWSKIEPLKEITHPEFDTEGRITCIEFPNFYLINVYTPNSQNLDSERFNYRIQTWDPLFKNYIISLNKIKNTIICGDFNVAYLDIDCYNPIKYKNKFAGFYDSERENFSNILSTGFIDVLRYFNKNQELYTYWNQRVPSMRQNNKGWRIDYFLINNDFINKIINCKILSEIYGSDHCPLLIEVSLQ